MIVQNITATKTSAVPVAPPDVAAHTVWGLSPVQLHDRYWAARGVQVVRLGEQVSLFPKAKLFLLSDANSLFIFSLTSVIDTINWIRPSLLFIRLHDSVEHGYRERVVTDHDGQFLGFRRLYQDADIRLNRLCLTTRREMAELWQQARDLRDAWRQLRRSVNPRKRVTVSIEGRVYQRKESTEVMQCLRDLVQVWRHPDTAIPHASRMRQGVWGDVQTPPCPETRFIGPVWVGSGRSLQGVRSVVGPAVLWDDPAARPAIEQPRFDQMLPFQPAHGLIELRNLTSMQRIGKRAFDILFSLFALAITLPIYPVVCLLILIEDGWPFFFVHRRETRGGVDFPCLKFRTMRKDADQIKAALEAKNVSDGPHFFIEDDPRMTRVGKWLRKLNIDELPQFFNVLVGHMSVVGPRPSPHKENQYCPSWREARLSVRPGITGLWQVKRSRQEGLDFQEWIQYDIQYVENVSWRLDLWIIWRTIVQIARKLVARD